MKKLFLILALSMPMALMAQEKKDASVSIPQSENTIRMAAELSKYGYAHNDALSLIQAARLCKQAGLVKADVEKKEEQGKESTAQKKGNISWFNFTFFFCIIRNFIKINRIFFCKII